MSRTIVSFFCRNLKFGLRLFRHTHRLVSQISTMTYTIGDRRITLDDELSPHDRQLVLAHSKLFKYCLNNAAYKFLINVKKIIHLYSDIITIYLTLLRKIPDYDDVTLMTNKVKLNLIRLEDDLNRVFGDAITGSPAKKGNWEDKHYASNVRQLAMLILDLCIEAFDAIVKNLNCIDLFFNNFNNLRKLLIPYLTNQTKSVAKSLAKAHYLFKLTTITDEIASISELTAPVIKQLRKIEKITSGIEREALILETAFAAFDPSLQQYTSILLGRAILKRTIDERECQIIKRREVCFRAAEHVGSIPLTEDQATLSSMDYLAQYLSYVVLVLVALISVILYRLIKVVFG